MSKKGLKTMLVCIVLLIGLVTLFACNKSDVADKDGQTKVIVKIQDEDGSIYKENVVFSDLFTLSLQKEGYTGRLYRDADFLKPLTKDSKVKNGDTVYVKWTINSYTVTFMDGKTVLKPEKVKHGSAATAPEVPEKDGKTFKGWDKPFDNVTSDLIVNAKWETKKFTLTFINFDGTTVYTEEVEYGASIEDAYNNAVEKVDIEGPFEYDGWYEVGDETTTLLDENNLPEMPARNVTYKLKLKLTLSAIGDNTAITVPGGFTYGEKSATFTVSGDTHDGVNYEYEWTILKDGKEYKKQTTTSGSITIENPDAGTYVASVKVVASKEGCGSVEKDFSAGETLTVSRADISDITVTGVEMTYGDKTAKIGISGLREGDVITYKEEREEEFKENVDLSVLDCGEYGYYVRISRGDNYNPYTSGKITVTINRAEVTATVTPDKDKLTYGDNLPSLTATINGETYKIESGKYTLQLKDGMQAITGSVANNVGTYNINVDVKKSGLRENYPNYDITVETKGTIKINQAKLTVTVSLDKTELTYGEDSPIISYTFSGLKSSDKEDDFTITKTKFAEKLDAGTYTATAKVSGEKTKFYEITVNTVDFKVNKKPATITIDKVNDITYGDEEPRLSAKVDGVLAGDKLSYKLETNYTVGAGKGEYTASVVFNAEAAENKNYAIIATGTTFNVGTKDLTIKLNKTPTVAIGKTYTVNAEHLEKIGLVAGDTVTGYVTITKDAAGVYNKAADFDTTHLDVTNAGCYVISYEMSVEFVEVKFAIDFADVTLTYDGKPHGVLVTAKEGTNYTITYGESAENCNLEESPKYTNAGAYPIYFKVVDNKTQAEHVGYVTLTISPAEVTVKVDDVTITYGETPAFSYTVAGLVNGENLSGEAGYSGAGTDAGDYDISVSGLTASDNYAVTVKTGTLTINKKTAEVAWTIAENYVYSPAGQTLPTATYDGKTASLIFTKDGKACEFKNAGTYTVTIKEDKNYTLSGETTKTIVIEKATYTSVTAHEALSGIYDPNKTLGNYTLAEGFTWVNPDEVPVCTKTEYAAKYNKDPANYEDFVTTVTLVLQKATVALAQNLFEFNFDGASHEIGTTVRYNNIEVTDPYTLTYKKEFSDAGTHRTLVTMEADNYDLPENTYVYVKVKGVKVGSTYYTIEDALFKSKSGDTVEFISAAKEVSFAPRDVAEAIYADDAYRTVKAGVTLKLASDEDSSAKIGKPTYGKGVGNYVDTDSSKIKYKLILNESTVLEVYGNILIQGLLGVNGPGLSGHTSGNHSQIINNGTINLNSGANLDLRGYIKGAGTIEARSGAIVYSPFVVYDYRGGTNTATVYRKGNIAPFRIYEMPNIQCNYSILYGAEHKGYLDLYASDKHRTAVATIFGKGSAMMIMEDSTAHITTTYERTGNLIGETTLTMTGKVKMGVLKIKVTTTVTVAMNEVRFPMPWNFTINVGDGLNPTTFTLPDDYKMMTGATVNVKKSATVNLTGTLLIYKSFTDTPFGGTVYPNKGEAKLNIEGVVNAIGGIAGEVHGINGGKVIIGNNAILSITEKEGNSGSTSAAEALVNLGEFVTVATISEVATFVNADNSTVAAETNRTYNYNNGTWQ
ncbi:MAG: MBG domain-containing protein [Clostridiales bacterium]|nr:MBG domain-containing protein [Clostridiales bacterium]MDY2721339.1 MBG domain-containing protein [Eubacteriales bacterium]